MNKFSVVVEQRNYTKYKRYYSKSCIKNPQRSQLNWSELIAPGWTGPILVRSGDYLKGLQRVLARTQRRVVHNAALVMFALSVLPAGRPDALVCARATMWALPEAAGALYAAQFGEADVRERFTRVSRRV